jgi:quinoprotein glucose dehydrogenase
MSATRPVAPFITGLVFALIGAGLVGSGAWLAALGGSLYYGAAGLAFLLCAGLLIAKRAEALLVFTGLLLGTLAWALWEVGLDWWPLAARGDIIFVAALWLLTPWVFHPLGTGGRSPRMFTLPLWAGVLACGVVLVASLFTPHHDIAGRLDLAAGAPDAGGAAVGDWPAYGRTQAGQRYAPLTQITPENVTRLRQAWIFHTGDIPGPHDPTESTFEVTPIKIADTVYLCSQHQRVFALDAATGRQRWTFDPHVADNPTFQHLTCRGVSYATAPAEPGGTCAARIVLGTNDARLIELDAASGKPCDGFGVHGTVDLNVGMPDKTPGFYEVTSPPVVTDRLIVVNGSVIDNYSTHEPSGVIRAFDTQSGALVWAWDSGNLDENALPSPTHRYTLNSPNSWITMSYDPALRMLYVPMGVQTPDIWGGNRGPVAERFSSALVALQADTGHRLWTYQTVHHDLWDMDLPSQPTLADIDQPDGTRAPAVIAPAKTGNLFVLDRRDGHLLVPAPERPVPQGAAQGDRSAPTQPFSDLTFRPAALITGADMWGATMFDELACRIMFHRLRYEGTFTPPSLQGTLVFPGNLGMFEWGGIAVDPVRQIAIANPIAVPFVSRLIPRGPNNPAAPDNAHPSGSEIGVQPMYGTPYGVKLSPFMSPLGIPCYRPPWGYMAGIDLKTRHIAWMHRNGTIRGSVPVPLPIPIGAPALGGPLVTAGGVAFLAASSDYYLRAYDVRDGTELWRASLPAGGQATPMSYEANGTQFVVIAAGGHGSFGTTEGDAVIAYALPEGRETAAR